MPGDGEGFSKSCAAWIWDASRAGGALEKYLGSNWKDNGTFARKYLGCDQKRFGLFARKYLGCEETRFGAFPREYSGYNSKCSGWFGVGIALVGNLGNVCLWFLCFHRKKKQTRNFLTFWAGVRLWSVG